MDKVNHPDYYNVEGKAEVIDVIESWKLNFHLGNALKYICRAGLKDKSKEKEDLEKALWYVKRHIKKLKANKDMEPPLEQHIKKISPHKLFRKTGSPVDMHIDDAILDIYLYRISTNFRCDRRMKELEEVAKTIEYAISAVEGEEIKQ